MVGSGTFKMMSPPPSCSMSRSTDLVGVYMDSLYTGACSCAIYLMGVLCEMS